MVTESSASSSPIYKTSDFRLLSVRIAALDNSFFGRLYEEESVCSGWPLLKTVELKKLKSVAVWLMQPVAHTALRGFLAVTEGALTVLSTDVFEMLVFNFLQ